MLKKAVAGLTAAVALGGLTACGSHTATPNDSLSSPDPVPGEPTASKTFDAAGGTFAYGQLKVRVPTGVVSAGQTIGVTTTDAIGPYGVETFGQPVVVDHAHPLNKPLTLTWTLPKLSTWQRRSIVLAKWDESERVWRPQSVPVKVSGQTLTATVQSFSMWDWISSGASNIVQTVGEWTGKRADPPKCNGQKLPSWVQGTVSPSEDTDAAALLACFEPDKDSRVTERVVNNRSFAQQLVMVNGGQYWAWTWPGDQSLGVTDTLYDTARKVFDTKDTYLIPPTTEVALGVARPAEPGSYVIESKAQVNVKTIFADLVVYVFDNLSIGGTDNPYLDAFLQAGYECGGKALLDSKASDGLKDKVKLVVSTIADCTDEVRNPESKFGKRFQQLANKAVAKSGLSKEAIAKSRRLIGEAGKVLAALKVIDVSFYVDDQLQNALVGDQLLSIRGRGTPQKLGAWSPSCSSASADSNALYKNVALQDQFADTAKELWQFTGWESAAKQAVAPLARCGSSYLSELASVLPTAWGDRRAAQIVADAIASLSTKRPSSFRRNDRATGAAWVSPSGNISCVMEGFLANSPFVECTIADHSWAPPPNSSCGGDYGSTVGVSESTVYYACRSEAYCHSPLIEPGYVSCGQIGSGTWWWRPSDGKVETASGEAAVLPYGSKIRINRFECTSRRSGMKCQNLGRRFGFSISRGSVDTW